MKDCGSYWAAVATVAASAGLVLEQQCGVEEAGLAAAGQVQARGRGEVDQRRLLSRPR